MGSTQSIEIPPICVPISDPQNPNESAVYRNIHCIIENGGNFIPTYRGQPESATIIDILKCSSVKYSDRDCVGERIIYGDGTAGPFKYISYKAFYEQVLAFGRGILELGIKRGDTIGIYSHNSIWWQTICFAAASVGVIIVPVYDSLGPTAAEYIMNHSEVSLLFVSENKFSNGITLANQVPGLKKIILMGNNIPENNLAIDLLKCSQIIDLGKDSLHKNIFAHPDDLSVIMYTSGSTGVPKGCMLSQRNIVAGSTGLGNVNLGIYPDDTYLSFLPLAHIYALTVELMMYAIGIRVGFARGSIKDLVDDIKELSPTIIIAVPRVLNRIYQGMQNRIDQKPKIIQSFIRSSIKSKAGKVKANIPHSLIGDMFLFKDFRAAMGGRIRLIVNGGAPLLPEVFEFLSATVTPNIVQGYGLTETCAGVSVQEIPVADPSTVGPPSIVCEIKLRKVEGTDYEPNGSNPAGELLVRGPCVFKGYYKNEELTSEVFVDGWFATGDIVMITPQKQIRIIDRAKQLVKMSQGEYISLTMLSELYASSDVASFVFVYADASHDKPVALVVPKGEKIAEWNKLGILDIKNDPTVHQDIINSFEKVFNQRNLRGFERIVRVLVETTEPTVDNGLLTPSMKPQFPALRKKYESELKKLFYTNNFLLIFLKA